MTIRQRIEKELTDRCLWPKEVTAVMDTVVDGTPSMTETRWNDNVEVYPPQFLAVLRLIAFKKAVEYIDANCPQHFARPLFTGEL